MNQEEINQKIKEFKEKVDTIDEKLNDLIGEPQIEHNVKEIISLNDEIDFLIEEIMNIFERM